MVNEELKKELITLIEDYRDFNSGLILVQPIPSAVEFAKQVSKGYPCVYQAYSKIRDQQGNHITKVDPALLVYPAFSWIKQDLLNLIDEEVEVAVTPTGRADDIHHVDGQDQPVFLAPATINMTIQDLLEKFDSTTTPPTAQPQINTSSGTPICYLQSQNSNLTTTPSLHRVLKHIPPTLPFATPILSDPEATNLWIGDHNSTTSTHRDPYENLYLVLKGSKTFTLYPPVDELTLPTQLVRTGRYVYDTSTNTFTTVLDEANTSSDPLPRIPWVTVDPLSPREEVISNHEMYAYSSPRTVTVNEGQILYLPSGWYHHVQQKCGTWEENGSVAPCIAVNWWFDVEYEGEKYVMRQLLGRLKGLLGEAEEEEKEQGINGG